MPGCIGMVRRILSSAGRADGRNPAVCCIYRIKEVLEEQGHNACWLASQIPCERSNVYNIFKRESIGIDLLFRISEVLGHDFFKEISDEIVREMGAGNGK